MSETKPSEKPPCKIIVNPYGGIEVQAPTKEECIELFKEATSVKKKSPIQDEACV